MPDFSRRADTPELMDEAALDETRYAALLGDLARVNLLTFAYRPTLRFIARATKDVTSFSLLDVGYGHGDMLRRIARWAGRRKVAATLTGIDLNPKSEPVARAATPPASGIDFRTGDYADQGRHDLIVSSLVAHHMTDAELIAFLRFMEAHAKRGWMINDIYRHRLAYIGFAVLACLMRWHPIVRHDGKVSVTRAFQPQDWRRLIGAAGLDPQAVRVRHYFPFRLCVERLK